MTTNDKSSASWEMRTACNTGKCHGWWFEKMELLCWDCLFRFRRELGLDAAGEGFQKAAKEQRGVNQ